MSLGGKYVRAKNNCLIFLLVRYLLEDKAFRLKGIYVQGEKTTNNPPPRNGAVEIRLLLIVTPVPCSPTPDQRSQWEGSFRFHHCVGKLRFPNGHVFSQTRAPGRVFVVHLVPPLALAFLPRFVLLFPRSEGTTEAATPPAGSLKRVICWDGPR